MVEKMDQQTQERLIAKSDPRHEQAQRVLDEAHKFWKLQPYMGAVQWIEDTLGRLVIFTRGEYRPELMAGVDRTGSRAEFFQLPDPTPEPMEAITHTAGVGLQIGGRILQRCAVCGAVLIDQATDPQRHPRLACFEMGDQVTVRPGQPRRDWITTRHEAGDELPGDSCYLVDALEDGDANARDQLQA